MFSTLLPSLKLRQGRSGKSRVPHLLCCQGFAVVYYSFTLGAADLPDSGIYERHPQLLQRQGRDKKGALHNNP